jgi:AraC-like DNA-binding protein
MQITSLAAKFGYETPGAFAAMFKRVMGVAPSQYLATAKPQF